jgi:cysteine desulfurase
MKTLTDSPCRAERIYLDYNASTPVDRAVAAAMRPFLGEAFGNPSSGHWASAPAKAALEQARGEVAALLGASPEEIVFTSGGSEANNLAIKGTFFALKHKAAHIITTEIEHPAVLAPANGWAVLSLTFRWTGQAASIQGTYAAP